MILTELHSVAILWEKQENLHGVKFGRKNNRGTTFVPASVYGHSFNTHALK